jgi:hypothetical protein
MILGRRCLKVVRIILKKASHDDAHSKYEEKRNANQKSPSAITLEEKPDCE